MVTNRYQAIYLSGLAAVLSSTLLRATPAEAQPAPPVSPAPVVDYEYDANGNSTKVTQAKGVSNFDFKSKATYDSLDRRKDATDAKLGVTYFGYDGLDRTTSIRDPRNLLTEYPRNGLGDTTKLISPDTGTEAANRTYDAAGNLKTRTDSRGVLATYGYDALNRLASVAYTKSGSPTQSYTWAHDETGTGFSNGVGRLTSTTHPTGSTQYAYDTLGRLVVDTQKVKIAAGANSLPVTTVVSYGYDAAGHISSITYPSGRKLTIAYSGGQPVSVALAKNASAAASTLISQIQFEPFGGIKSWQWQLASGTQLHERITDGYGRVVRYRLGANLRDISYDPADRISGYTHYAAVGGAPQPSLNQSFAYDELGRLTSITTASATWAIGYDANGNRISVTLNGGTPSVYTTPTTSNRLTSITNPARSFGYDNAGNTTSDTAGYTATYDLANRLASLTKGGITTTYSVDGQGRRIRKFDSAGATSTVIFVYDQQGQLLGEYDKAGKEIREYVWLDGTPIAVFTPDPSGPVIKPPLVYYIHTDHLNTPRLVLDPANNLRWSWIAEPFGTTAPNTNPQGLGVFTFHLRFPGQYFDQESGLHYNYFRDYDSTIGRYAQSDPIGLAGGINTYTYVASDPAGYVDEDGLNRGRGGTTNQPNPNVVSNVQANNLINQIQQINPQFRYPPNLTAPGQGGYTGADVQFLRAALARAQVCQQCGGGTTVWPSQPQLMDQFLGVPGVRVPDGPTTAGRGKIIWRPSLSVTIKYERHPYDVTAPTFHCGPHWHLEGPLGPGGRPLFRETFVPGEFIPGF